ncbi:PBP1A family penicillin-binding protein [Aliiroseovarius subalbicans]|uniref:transglycosylase domain-containing protein n=1 Tax=Aliiroseovarius subalbicans TaxID=2925840 RepID=UPI001F569E73|nr:PBP1A family penicillin-binding protein [Aliiroseovarius subalbicans]MCI2399474.1 PBP1A family penicillin-binding protein [Aliiroseovarius subalbicans]
MAGSGRKKPPLVADKRYGKPKPAKKPATKAARKPTRKPTRKPARKPSRKPNRKLPALIAWPLAGISWVLRLIWRFTWKGGVVVALLLAMAVFYFSSTLPPLNELLDGRAKGSVTMLDRNDATFAWRGDRFGGIVTADTVAPAVKNAVVATEDKRFYRHFGLSPRGIASAVRINLSEGRGPLSGHGGSTLTQQVAKLLCLGVPYDPAAWDSEAAYERDCRQGSLWRKLKEAVYAMALEVKYSKDDILTIYLNRAFLGSGSFGFEAASQRYFGHSAAQASVAEAAMMAGMLTAPTRFAPTNNLQRSQDRAETVLKLMFEQGFISATDRAAAVAAPATLSPAAQARAGGYFADWVMGEGPDFLTRDTTEDVIIRTTLDQDIQRAAEAAMKWVFENKVREGSKAQAAIVVMSADGAVRAMVGGRQTKVTGAFNRATQAKRQTGSAFKPFVYGVALDLGYTWDSFIEDAPLTINIPGSGPWSPRNYTGEYKGTVTLTEALRHSLNTPAVRLSEAVGRENVRTAAASFGIESDLALGPALALGASESSLLEMTGAYAGILNGGSSVTPYGLIDLRLMGDEAPLMTQSGGIGERVISPQAAEQLIFMMHDVVQNGTGQRARLDGREAAGKTGTTQAARDAWFLGFTADYVAGVWMGYDDNTPLKGVTGGGLPADIWHETMTRVHADLPATPLPMIRPAPDRITTPAPQTAPRPVTPGGNIRGEDVILDVLRSILGLGNN